MAWSVVVVVRTAADVGACSERVDRVEPRLKLSHHTTTKHAMANMSLLQLLIFALAIPLSNAWMTHSRGAGRKIFSFRLFSTSEDGAPSTTASSSTAEMDSLIDMDVVIYSLKNQNDNENSSNNSEPRFYFGAVQEDGVLSPLSAWTTEPAFGDSIEFLVDEADRFSLVDAMDDSKIQLHHLLSEEELSYGSRQCHRGVGNPHGEESELLYYVEQDVIDKFGVVVVIKPDLEILW